MTEPLRAVSDKFWLKVTVRTRRQQEQMLKRLDAADMGHFEAEGIGQSADVWDNRRRVQASI